MLLYLVYEIVFFIQKELFQRDVFPNALMSWEPTCSVDEWRNGVLNEVKFVDLRPEGMQECESPMKHRVL